MGGFFFGTLHGLRYISRQLEPEDMMSKIAMLFRRMIHGAPLHTWQRHAGRQDMSRFVDGKWERRPLTEAEQMDMFNEFV